MTTSSPTPELEPTSLVHEMDGAVVTACERCPALVKSRRGILNGRGAEGARIMFVEEKPDRYSNQRGKGYMGEDSHLLVNLLEQAGIDPAEVWLTYGVKCWPYGERTTTAAERRACREHLDAEIAEHRPRVIVTLGAAAYKLFRKGTLNNALGQAIPYGDALIVPTYAPSYLMHGHWPVTDLVVAHLQKALAISQGQLDVQDLEDARGHTRILRTVEDVEALRDYLTSEDVSVITADSETTGLDWTGDEVLDVSFSALDADMRPIGAGFTVPLMRTDKELWPHATNGKPKTPKDWRQGHVQPAWEGADEARVVEAIRDIFASGKPVAIQNAGFDIRMFERDAKADRGALTPDIHVAFGWELANLRYDSMILQRLINENLPSNESTMLALYSGMPYYEDEISEQSQDKKRMDLADDTVRGIYAALDADGLARILPTLIERAKAQDVLRIHDEISVPMIRATWAMTRRGLLVDMPYFAKLADRFRTLVSDAEKAAMEAYGRGWFNLNKPADLQRVLFAELGLPQSGRKTQKARECEACNDENRVCDKHDSTGKEALIDIKSMMERNGEDPHPIIDAILRWKFVAKRRSTYVDGGQGDGGLLRFIKPTHRVYPTYAVNRAVSGRLGAYDPPIQTWPKEVEDELLGESKALRRCFIAPPGKVWMEADWSQGELWVMAYTSGDETLLDILKSGRDIHSFVARKFCESGISSKFPLDAAAPHLDEREWKEQYGGLRRDAKVFVFGLDYGMTEMGIAERLHCTVQEGARLRNFYMQDIFPGLGDYFDSVREELKAYQLVTDWVGRLGHFSDPDFVARFARNGAQDWEEQFRKATNMPVQAGLNDIHCYAHTLVENSELFRGRFEIVLAVHDSIAGYAEDNGQKGVTELAWQLKEHMEGVVPKLVRPDGKPLGWTIPIEVEWGNSWGHMPNALTASGELRLVEEEKAA